MKCRYFFLLFLSTFLSNAQQKIVKTIKSDAPYVEVKTDGIDNLIIEESDSNELVMTITDKDGLGFIENFSCDDFNCVLNIKTELKANSLDINKVNFISSITETNVSAVVKIPKGKKVTIYGETIDIQTNGYQGILRILIDSGNIKIKALKGITEVNLFTGTVFAKINNNALDVRTRKGTILFNEEIQKSPFKKKKKKAHILAVKSINANVILTEQ